MTQREKQAIITSFRGRVGDYILSCGINPSQGGLELQVYGCLTTQRFKVVLDQEYIDEQDDFFKSVFQDSQDILDYLYSSYNSLMIENGSLKFQYRYGGNKKKTKHVQIKLNKSQSVEAKPNLKISLAQKLRQRDTKILLVENKCNDLAQQFRLFTQKTNIILEQMSIKYEEQHQINNNLQQQLQIITEKFEDIQEIKLRVEKEEDKSLQLTQKLINQQQINRAKVQQIYKKIQEQIKQRIECQSKIKEKYESNILVKQHQIEVQIQKWKKNGQNIEQQLEIMSKQHVESKAILEEHKILCNKLLQRLQATQKKSQVILEETKQVAQGLQKKVNFLESQILKVSTAADFLAQKQRIKLLEQQQQINQIRTRFNKFQANINTIYSQILKKTQKIDTVLIQLNSLKGQRDEYAKAQDLKQLTDRLIREQKRSDQVREQLRNTFQKLQVNMQKLKQVLSEQSTQKLELSQELQIVSKRTQSMCEIELRLQQQQQKNREFKEIISSMMSSTRPLIQQVESLRNQHKTHSQLLRRLDNIGHHPKNPHQTFYSLISISGVSARLKRVGEGGWLSFVNKFQIFSDHKVRYSIRITKLTNSALMVGFCTQRSFGIKRNFQHIQTVYYDCYNRSYHEGGIIRALEHRTSEGDVIDCLIDLEINRCTWSRGGKNIECNLPNSMRGKTLYLSILMLYKDDEVDVSI